MGDSTTAPDGCIVEEPFGRYSASGGLFAVRSTNESSLEQQQQYIYSFGGDTSSDADGRGGVVSTNFRFHLGTSCWERLQDSPNGPIGYRATATWMTDSSDDDGDSVYVLFGSDPNNGTAGLDTMHRYSLANDEWTLLEASSFSSPTTIPPPRWKHAAVALDDTRILVTGGRDGDTVRNDAWILDTMELSWTQIDFASDSSFPPVYRHGMAFDTARNVVWIYGGLDGSLQRYPSGSLWKLDLDAEEIAQGPIDGSSPLPPQLASHSMEYVAEWDALLLWGGTCQDDSELHIFDIQSNAWCRMYPENRPDKRDAMIWSLQYPLFYVAQGDSICYN